MPYRMMLAVNFTPERLELVKLLALLTKSKVKAVTEDPLLLCVFSIHKMSARNERVGKIQHADLVVFAELSDSV